MEPNLLVGDRFLLQNILMVIANILFHLVLQFLKAEYYTMNPKRGDVVVFKTPADNRTDYIKRFIGLPGDQIQFIDSNLYINNSEIIKSKVSRKDIIYCGKSSFDVFTFEEKLPNGKKYISVYLKDFPFQNSDKF